MIRNNPLFIFRAPHYINAMFPEIINYTILREIGSGGMASVYEAEDTRLLRRVAIKVLHPHLCKDPANAERFIREARAAAKIDHPNVVRIFDFAVSEDLYYIVMEYVPGTNADRLLINAPDLLAKNATAIMIEIAHALMQAHNLGIIHRDIKPANILIHHQGRAMLSDFGLAHHLPDARLTSCDAVAGTPLFMSPEQLTGKPLTPATDIYSWGICWYTLIAGKLPYATIAFPDVLTCIRTAQLIFNPEHLSKLPPLCHEILRRCCCANPSDRIADARRLVELLASIDQHNRWSLPANLTPGASAAATKTTSASASATLILPIAGKNTKRTMSMALFFLVATAIVAFVIYETGVIQKRPPSLQKQTASTPLQPAATYTPPDDSGSTRPAPSPTDSENKNDTPVIAAPPLKNSGNAARRSHAVPPADSGGIFIFCTPWADVAIDSLPVGTTPFAQPFRLPAGRHTIALSNTFSEPLFDTVSVIADTTIRRRYSLPARHR